MKSRMRKEDIGYQAEKVWSALMRPGFIIQRGLVMYLNARFGGIQGKIRKYPHYFDFEAFQSLRSLNHHWGLSWSLPDHVNAPNAENSSTNDRNEYRDPALFTTLPMPLRGRLTMPILLRVIEASNAPSPCQSHSSAPALFRIRSPTHSQSASARHHG